MRLMLLIAAGLLAASTAAAQNPPAVAPERPIGEQPLPDFGVSLERIREGLLNPPELQLRGFDRMLTFRVEVQERATFEQMFKNTDFRPGPIPPGGIYAYEQQRRLFNPVDRPLMQPYAAFNGGQLITIAIQNLLGYYLGKPALDALKEENRKRALRNAQQEVNQSIEEYCAQQPNRYEILLCNPNR